MTEMIRIGEVARRSGVSTELLRAWERRYALLAPTRTSSGYRLYGDEDVARVRHMRDLIAGGMSAGQAAEVVRAGAPAPSREVPVASAIASELAAALDALDESSAQAAIDRLLAAVTVETFLTEVALPLLRHIGEAWAAGRTTVGHEHFATSLVRGRLLGLARGWDRGEGRRVALACLPGEQHDVGLIAFGIALSRSGKRVLYLGQDTPLESVRDLADGKRCDALVVSSVDPRLFAMHARELRTAAKALPLAIGGAGADAATAKRIGARLLPPDIILAARELLTESPRR
jgi:DNA-binding transcriptional MerR regulator